MTGAADLLDTAPEYRLDEQVGFILRQVQQRHALIFAAAFDDLTPMQWAALAKLAERGECSQNLLGAARRDGCRDCKGRRRPARETGGSPTRALIQTTAAGSW